MAEAGKSIRINNILQVNEHRYKLLTQEVKKQTDYFLN